MSDEKRSYTRKSPQEKAQADPDKAQVALERARTRRDKADAASDAADEAYKAAQREVEYKASHPALRTEVDVDSDDLTI